MGNPGPVPVKRIRSDCSACVSQIAALDFLLHLPNQLAQADIQPFCDLPEGFDVGVVLPAFDLGQVAAGEGSEAGEDFLGHTALQAQAADHPPGDGVVVALRHIHRSFDDGRRAPPYRGLFLPRGIF